MEEINGERPAPKKALSAKLWVLALTLSLFIIPSSTSSKEDHKGADERNSKELLLTRAILQHLTMEHYRPQGINDALSEKIFDLYLKRLDYNKRFFLQSDVEILEKDRLSLDDQLLKGRVSFMEKANKLYEKRARMVREYYGEILKNPFDFTKEESLESERDKRHYATDEKELREIWRKAVKHQTLLAYLNLLETEEEGSEDKKDKGKDEKKGEEKPLRKKKEIDPSRFSTELESKARAKVKKTLDHRFKRLLEREQDDRLSTYLNALSNAFDPHTGYFPPAKKENFDIGMTGTLEGIGAVLRDNNGFINVVRIVPGSASWRQKELEAGDVILKVAQGTEEAVDIVDAGIDYAVKLIRGPKGTEVRLTVKKPDDRILIIPIIRDVVIIEETYAKSAILHDENSGYKMGYIYLPKFYRDFNDEGGRSSTEDVKKELEILKKSGVAGVILDLRDNGGGAFKDAVEMSGLFIPRGPIVQVKKRRGSMEVYRDDDPSVTYEGPLVVLINRVSASASEIVAAALQDYKRAIVVGSSNSYGKGTVQNFINLDSYVPRRLSHLKPLGYLKLTIQQFYRINGESTQERGVQSDILLPEVGNHIDFGEDSLEYSLPWDKVKPLHFSPWSQKLPSAKTLQEESMKRVEGNETFSFIREYNKANEERQKETLQTLVLKTVLEERRQAKEEGELLKKIQEDSSFVKITHTGKRLPGKEWEEREKEWFDGIKKDAYIMESFSILRDLQKTSVN